MRAAVVVAVMALAVTFAALASPRFGSMLRSIVAPASAAAGSSSGAQSGSGKGDSGGSLSRDSGALGGPEAQVDSAASSSDGAHSDAGDSGVSGSDGGAASGPGSVVGGTNSSASSYTVLRSMPGYDVLEEVWHDGEAFTQGLYVDGDTLVESTGLYRGKSSLRRIDPATGEVQQIVHMGSQYFGEGCAPWDGKIIVLTWRERTGFVYNPTDFSVISEFLFTTERNEGWGITHDGTQLLVSDGSSYIFRWNPETFTETSRVEVVDHITNPQHPAAVRSLNELEYVKGELLANIWYNDRVVRINPSTGHVIGYIDFSHLHPTKTQSEDVLNGLAYDASDNTLWVTGKKWHKMFRVRLDEAGLDPPFPAV